MTNLQNYTFVTCYHSLHTLTCRPSIVPYYVCALACAPLAARHSMLWYNLIHAASCILACHAHMTLQVPVYCSADINPLSHNMLASADRHQCAVVNAPEQGSPLKAGFPASIKNLLLLLERCFDPIKCNGKGFTEITEGLSLTSRGYAQETTYPCCMLHVDFEDMLKDCVTQRLSHCRH